MVVAGITLLLSLVCVLVGQAPDIIPGCLPGTRRALPCAGFPGWLEWRPYHNAYAGEGNNCDLTDDTAGCTPP